MLFKGNLPMAPIDTPDTVKLKNNYDDEVF